MTPRNRVLIGLAVVGILATNGQAEEPTKTAVVNAEFVFDVTPTKSCHASTLVETRPGVFLAAWFAGTAEKNPDVVIYSARREDGRWTTPKVVADGIRPEGPRMPCWNPVLSHPEGGPILLFYKVGPSPTEWWGELIASTDQGETWSKPRRLPDGVLGPIKNKPLALADGTLLCPSSVEDEAQGWRVFLERTGDLGQTWTRVGPLNDGKEIAAIQPSILTHADGRLQILCRTRQDRIAEAWSGDQGKTWGPMTLTDLPNPNAGTDAVTLADNRQLLVYNHTTKGRTPLNVAVSRDGKAWKSSVVLESRPGEYSYPAVIQARDGKVHVTYTWQRTRIKHVTLDPTLLDDVSADARP